jgi:hypothetical protein
MVSFDEEWAQLQAEAQQRENEVHTQLNETDGDGSGSVGEAWYSDLDVDTDKLRKLSDLAAPLRDRLETVIGGLRDDPDWRDDGMSVLDVTRALRRVRNSWEGRLTSLRHELSLMEKGFSGAADGLEGTEEEIRSSLGAVAADTNSAGDGERP